MSTISQNISNLVDMLPEGDQLFAFEFVKKLVKAWDPDYTKLTPQEAKSLERAMDENETIAFTDLKQEMNLN